MSTHETPRGGSWTSWRPWRVLSPRQSHQQQPSPKATNNIHDVNTRDRLTLVTDRADGVVTMTYPPKRDSEFEHDLLTSGEQILKLSTPFGVVHDFSHVSSSNLWQLSLSPPLQLRAFRDAKAIARSGLARCVAFVLPDCGDMLNGTIQLALLMSPVQPARAFRHNEAAQAAAWAAEKVSQGGAVLS